MLSLKNTPVFSILAVIVYSLALFTTIRQNKIILSQNIKPFYEKEIEKLLSEGKTLKFFSLSQNKEKEDTDAFNYLNSIHDKLISLSRDEFYREDYEEFKRGIVKGKRWFENRNYYNELFYLSQFTSGTSSIYYFYTKIISLISEINTSNLVQEDKSLLKKQIFRMFLNDYMGFVKIQLELDNFTPLVPDIYGYSDEGVEFKQLAYTKFGDAYRKLKEEYSKIYK